MSSFTTSRDSWWYRRREGYPAFVITVGFWLFTANLALAVQAPGPDSFGYTVAPTTNFTFIQITNGGSRVLSFNDDGTFTANLGFTFSFYGTNYTNVSFNPNGLMTFAGISSNWFNVDLTTTSPSNNLPVIAVLWDDWETESPGTDAVYYKTQGSAPNRQFIVQWNKVEPIFFSDPVTFEAVLFEGSNRIVFSYFDAVVSDNTTNTNAGISATVGIRDTSGQVNGRNLQWSYNQAAITNGLNLLFVPPNQPPVATNDTAITAEDTPVTIAVLTNDRDPDGDTVTLVSVIQGTNGVASTNGNGTVTYSPATNFFGSDQFSYTITDGHGGSATGLVSVTVTSVNDPPTMSGLTNLSILEDSGLQTVTLSGVNPGPSNESTQTLTITATSGNPALIPNPTVNYTNPAASGNLTFAPLADQFGSATITVVVKDNGGTNNGGIDSMTNSFTVTVLAVNDPPTMTALTNLTILEDGGLQTVSLSGLSLGPSNESTQTLTITATSDNASLIPNPTVNYTNPAASGNLTFAPVANQFGSATVTVVVKDNGGTANGGADSLTNSFIVTVLSVNDAPAMTALTNLTILEDNGLQTVSLIGLSPGPSNESTQTLTITATSDNASLIPNPTVNYTNPAASGNLTFAPVANQFGSATITVVVKDNGGTANGAVDSLTNSFIVTVLSVNDAPTMTALTNLTILEDSGLQTVTLSGLNPGPSNESTQTLTITATSDNPSLIPNPTVNYTNPAASGNLTFAPVANQFGSATITVVVKDNGSTTNGGIDSLTNSFTVTVLAVNDPPTMTAPTNLTILEDSALQTVSLSGLSPGPSNESTQTLTITASSGNPALIPNPTVNYTNPAASGNLTFAPVANQFGGATITVVVKDNGGTANGGVDSLTNSFMVTILSVNDAPTMTALTNLTILEDSGLQTVPLSGLGPGPSNESTQTLTITATSDNPALISNPTVNYTNPAVSGNLTFAPLTNQFGTATITVVVKDNGGTASGGIDSLTNLFTVTVLAVNDPPVANPDATNTFRNLILKMSTAALLANDTDVDGDILSVTGVSPSSSATGSVSLATSLVTYTPRTDFTGTDTFTYVINDGHGGNATGMVTVTVWPLPVISSITRPNKTNTLISFQGVPGAHYTIQASVNLTAWSNLGTAAESPPGQFQFQDTGTAGLAARFYRLRVP